MNVNTKKIFSSAKLFIGPLLFLGTLLYPSSLATEIQSFLAIFLLVIWLWIFTELPLFITGILGVTLSVFFGLVAPKEALAPFANPIIFLFLSGFLFARALEMTKLDEYLARVLLSHPKIRSNPKLIILAFYILAAFCSMWISNTAAVAMLLPLSYGLLKSLKQNFSITGNHFEEVFLLGLAYSATIGGNLTPIGSPPNLISIGLIRNLDGSDISFLKWIIMAIPISAVLFTIVFRRTISSISIVKESKNITSSEEYKNKENEEYLEPHRTLSFEQKNLLILFCSTIVVWVLPSFIKVFLPEDSSLNLYFRNNLSTSIVGLFFSSLLFIFPLKSEEKLLSSHHISTIDWGSLLLFGSGLSLGNILFQTGLAELFASQLSGLSGYLSPIFILLLFILGTIFFTEIASNTASANIIIPIMIAFSQKTSLSIPITAFAMAIACNSAFMLPVATPPNVIVYGTQKVRKIAMIKAGWKLNIFAFAVIAIYVFLAHLFF